MIQSLVRLIAIVPLCMSSTAIPSRPYLRLARHLIEDTTNITVASNVPLFLTLQYLDEATSLPLESRDKQNTVVSAFCGAVHEQAGGNQVKLVAAESGVLIETDDPSKAASDCTIVATNRVYGNGAPRGLFTLELSVLQTVYASSGNLTLLRPLVETGFSRGRGGRAQFLGLLQGSTLFPDLQDVGVLDGGLSPPTLPDAPSPSPSQSFGPTSTPTAKPTTARPTFRPTPPPSRPPTPRPTTTPPTQGPSRSPSFRPSSVYGSLVPSHSSSNEPSVEYTETPDIPSPTTAPNKSPSLAPSISLSQVPSDFQASGPLVPSNIPSTAPTKEKDRTLSIQPSVDNSIVLPTAIDPSTDGSDHPQRGGLRPLVIAAIVGGAFAALVFCFCLIRCCFCNSRSQTGEGAKGSSKKATESSTGATTLPIVPEVVQLDDDNRSLANTTLGEYTAGRKPQKTRRILDIDSFDESSIYTSPYKILPSTDISEDKGVSKLASLLPSRKDTDTSADVDTFGAISLGGSGVPSDSETPSRLTELSGLDFVTDEGEDLFLEEGDGVLGAVDQLSPLYDRIEDMVAAELDDSSDSSSSSSPSVIGLSETDSPLDMLKYRHGNVVVVREADTLGSFPSENGSDFMSKSSIRSGTSAEDSSEAASFDTRSSVTSKIGNIRAPAEYKHEASPQSSTSSSHLDGRSHDAPGTYKHSDSGFLSNHKSPSSLHQTKSVLPHVTTNKCNSTTNSSFPPTSPIFSLARTSPVRHIGRDTGETTKINSTTCKTETSSGQTETRSPPQSYSEHNATADDATFDPPSQPNSTARDVAPIDGDAPIATPVTEKKVNSFRGIRSPASLKTIKQKLAEKAKAPVSPAPSSSDSEGDNQFLFGAIEGTLGPRSASADLESLGSRSGRSRDSQGKVNRRKSDGDSVDSRPSHISLASCEEKSEMSMMTPRTLEHDLQRLEKQLAVLKSEVKRTKKGARKEAPSSPLTLSTGDFASSSSHATSATRVSTKQRVVVVVPPGKLGVILANRRDGGGTVVAEVKPTSALRDSLSPGDKLVAIDGVDVTGMVVSDITTMMAQKATQERHLTVITSSKVKPVSQEMKSSSP